jgi:AcrR family transcriptional regulator
VLIEAERLFALEGFHGVSMRDIAQAADVKLALIVYHFETKAKLYHAIFEHRKDLFEERLQGLKSIADFTSPDALERIVHAFVSPILRSQMSSAGKSYAQLVVREASDPCSETRGIIAEYFDPFAREFVQAIQLALPRKSPEYVHWAYLFAVGALVMSVFDSRIARISNDTVKPANLAAKTRHLTTFIAAGIRGGPDL